MSIIRNILNSTVALINNSLPTTGSNTFVGTQTYSGSIIPAVNNTYDLGDSTHQFRHLYLSSGSLYIDGQKVLGSSGNELQITTDNGQSIKILEAGSDNIILQSADGNIELKSSGGGDVILDPTTGVVSIKGTMTIYSGNKILSSDGNAIQFGNDLGITGSITTTGNINGINLSTLNTTANKSATTGSNIFTGNQIITGSMYMTGDLVVYGSSSLQNITASAASLGTNTIILNAASPAFRFGGISVIDSGSSQATGSLFWDSENNRWVYQKESGSSYSGAMLISGPRNTSGLGNEESMTNNRLVMGIGGDHISSSNIYHNGTDTAFAGNVEVTGSLIAPQITLLNSYTSSNDTTNTTQNNRLTSLENKTGSLATTGSNTFTGNQIISASLYARTSSIAWNANFENTDGTESVGVYLAHGQGYGIAIDSSENDTKYIFKAMAGTGGGTGRGTIPVIFAQNNGSVGFGTASPDASYKVDINGNQKITGVHYVNFGGYTYYNSRFNNSTNNGQIFINNGSGQNLVLGETASNEYTFGPGSAASAPSATTLKLNTSTHAVTVGGTLTENSSIRYKENVETIKYGLDKVLQMRGVTYDKKNTKVKEVGVIAEEVYDILPEVVLKNEEGEIDSVSYGRIVGVLIEAIKEQQKQIEELKSLIK